LDVFPSFFTDNHTYTEIVPDDFVLTCAFAVDVLGRFRV